MKRTGIWKCQEFLIPVFNQTSLKICCWNPIAVYFNCLYHPKHLFLFTFKPNIEMYKIWNLCIVYALCEIWNICMYVCITQDMKSMYHIMYQTRYEIYIFIYIWYLVSREALNSNYRELTHPYINLRSSGTPTKIKVTHKPFSIQIKI